MAARLGNVLYWLGFSVAVICVAGAVLVALGTFPDLPSALGYLKPSKSLVMEMSFPRSDNDGEPSTYEAAIEIDDSGPWGRWAFEKALLKAARDLCERTQGPYDCFLVGDPLAWKEHPLGELPLDPKEIAAAYGYKVTGPVEGRVWRRHYTVNLIVTGAVLVFALFLYGIGWTARYILRGQAK